MSGWKTWVAAVSAIVWGVGGFVSGTHGVDEAAAFVTGGLALVGIGHKVDKLSDVLKSGQ